MSVDFSKNWCADGTHPHSTVSNRLKKVYCRGIAMLDPVNCPYGGIPFNNTDETITQVTCRDGSTPSETKPSLSPDVIKQNQTIAGSQPEFARHWCPDGSRPINKKTISRTTKYCVGDNLFLFDPTNCPHGGRVMYEKKEPDDVQLLCSDGTIATTTPPSAQSILAAQSLADSANSPAYDQQGLPGIPAAGTRKSPGTSSEFEQALANPSGVSSAGADTTAAPGGVNKRALIIILFVIGFILAAMLAGFIVYAQEKAKKRRKDKRRHENKDDEE